MLGCPTALVVAVRRSASESRTSTIGTGWLAKAIASRSGQTSTPNAELLVVGLLAGPGTGLWVGWVSGLVRPRARPWELGRVLELGLEQRLFLMSPPPTDVPHVAPGRTRTANTDAKSARLCRHLWRAYMADDTDEISRLVSFGELRGAWSPAGLTAWPLTLLH